MISLPKSDSGAFSGGFGPPPKKFEQQRENVSKFFGEIPDHPGYAHGVIIYVANYQVLTSDMILVQKIFKFDAFF